MSADKVVSNLALPVLTSGKPEGAASIHYPHHPMPAQHPPTRPTSSVLRRLTFLFITLLALILLSLAVPFLNVNRLQRRIARSLAESLGRPVHFDRISLALLPLPGFTIENFVVGEDPAFGAEPFIRANEVRATLRLASLWSRRVEFSRIRFTDPSINLVKLPDGRWNLQSILLQAARLDAAPTAASSTSPGAAPRFPYIEATGARLNLKLGSEKTPFSLTETDCALWLADPRTWQLRLEGRPMRTDTSVSNTGTFHLEGTLGRAPSWTEVPLNLKAAWRNVPLGEASRFVLARDMGLRAAITLTAAVRGTIAQAAVQASVHVADLRRADFVPAQTVTLDAECQATETSSFHALTDLRCTWPPAPQPAFGLLPKPEPTTLALTGAVPDIRRFDTAAFDLGTPGIPAATLLSWLRIASPRIPPDLAATGTLSGTAAIHPGTPLAAQLTFADATLTLGTDSLFTGDLTLHSTPTEILLSPASLALGGRTPATLDARFSPTGYTLRLTGTAFPAKLRALAAALPQLGDGLPEALPTPEADPDTPIRLDLTSTRTWTGPRTWHASTLPPSPRHH